MTAEQQARDMLERAGVEHAQEMSAGDLVEIANLIARGSEQAERLEVYERREQLAESVELYRVKEDD